MQGRLRRFAQIQRGLAIVAVVILLLIGASLITVLEQLRDRRRLLAILVAFGTRRSTIARSILWQAAVPILLGLTLAVIAGITLGAVLLQIVSERVRIDWKVVGLVAGTAAGVVLLVTAASMPALWRLMRADGLRTE
jgi:predicted lysophospholipase L1 biosynthesis ABC-type transport system permease subunit